MKTRLPRADAIMAALAAAGRPRSLAQVRNWTSGYSTMPAWAAVVIADATGYDLETLVREHTRRWLAKHGDPTTQRESKD